MFICSGTCQPRLVRKPLMCDLLKFVPGVCSPVTLHSVAAAALKHLRFASRCWSLLTSSASSDTSTPELSGLPSHLTSWNLDITSPQFRPPSFQGKAFFRHALAKLSPNFREKSYYIFTDRLSNCTSNCKRTSPKNNHRMPCKPFKSKHFNIHTKQ